MTELLYEPYAMVLLGIVFLFGGLGMFKLLRKSNGKAGNRPAPGDHDQKGKE